MSTAASKNDGAVDESAISELSGADTLQSQDNTAQKTPSMTSHDVVQSFTSTANPIGGKSPEPLEAKAVPGTYCRETGLNHTSLIGFGIQNCPKCNEIIQKNKMATFQTSLTACGAARPAETEPMVDPDINREALNVLERLNIGVQSMAFVMDTWRQDGDKAKAKAEAEAQRQREEAEKVEAEAAAREEATKKEYSNEVATDNFVHQVQYRDQGDYLVTYENRKNPLNIYEVSQKPTGGTVAIITSVIKTNIAEDRYRTPQAKHELIRAGFLGNPNVDIISFKQTMHLKSVPLIKVLQRVVKYYPGLNLQGQAVFLDSPFHFLAHHIPELESFRDSFTPKVTTIAQLRESDDGVTTPESEVVSQDKGNDEHSELALRHVCKILEFIKTDNIFGQQLEEELARHCMGTPLCTFPMLWLLYKPGTTVYISSSGGVEAFVVSHVEADASLSGQSNVFMESKTMTLTLWNLTFDGQFVVRQRRYEIIGSFDGPRPIADLKVVPAAFADKVDEGKIRDSLVELGRKWYSLLQGAPQQHYVGETMGPHRKRMLNARVVIDNNSYLRTMERRERSQYGVNDMGEDLKECPCNKCQMRRPHPAKGFLWAEYDVIDPTGVDSLELPESGNRDKMHRYILCSHQLWGFVLKSREWESLNVANCEAAKINSHAIDNLVMSDERKRMIKAIVQKHSDTGNSPAKSLQSWGADFIESKGDGQLFLLHGGPGVGKTFTAGMFQSSQCISELIGRPLLSLTSADFGSDELGMERNLSSWFKLAEAWGAVMLLDEADVWLERRMVSDLKRNSLVAVFLRCLEYYRGIMFLTTNRVGTFDDAFISRIHLTIYYEDLGEKERQQIWKQFFAKLEKERKDDIIVESRAKQYVLNDSEMRKIPWNGREIRNAFQTAVSLAEYRFNCEGGKDEGQEMAVLDKMDFEQVCQMSVDFKKYLKAVHGADVQDRAMKERIRAPVD